MYKKGDKMDPKNYRGISLLNTFYKILSNLLLKRLKPFTEEIIGEYQAVFMGGKSTINQIHRRKQAAEKSHEFNKDVHMLFVDFCGIVHGEWVPQGQTANQHFYLEVERLRENVRKKRPESRKSGSWMLHHDNDPGSELIAH